MTIQNCSLNCNACTVLSTLQGCGAGVRCCNAIPTTALIDACSWWCRMTGLRTKHSSNSQQRRMLQMVQAQQEAGKHTARWSHQLLHTCVHGALHTQQAPACRQYCCKPLMAAGDASVASLMGKNAADLHGLAAKGQASGRRNPRVAALQQALSMPCRQIGCRGSAGTRYTAMQQDGRGMVKRCKGTLAAHAKVCDRPRRALAGLLGSALGILNVLCSAVTV